MALAKTFLAIGIALVFVVFVAYGVYVIYEPPQHYYNYDDCYQKYNCYQILQNCLAQGTPTGGAGRDIDPQGTCYSSLEYTTCNENARLCQMEEATKTEERRKSYGRNSLIILGVIALAAIISGIFLIHLEGIGSGLIGGGVLTALWAVIYTFEYWLTWNRFLRLGILGLVLVVLIFLGYRRIDSNQKRK